MDATSEEGVGEMTDRVTILLMAFRACLLAAVDAIEEFLEMPRTKDMRKDYRRQ